MKVTCLAYGIARETSVAALATQPEFRKATRNMIYACAAVGELMGSLPNAWLEQNLSQMAVVVGTSEGELNTTFHFLKGLPSAGARPFLFQSSLHNATLGFVTQKFKLRGPGLTVSDSHQSGETALETAATLIRSGVAGHVLVLGVDGIVEGAEEEFAKRSMTAAKLSAGSAAVLLGGPDGSGLPILADFVGAPETTEPLHYGAQAVERLAEALRQS